VLDAATALVEVEDRGHTALYRVRLGEIADPVLAVRGGVLHGARAAGGHVFVQAQTATRPPELARLPRAGGELERITGFNDALLAELKLGRVEEVDFEGAGGERVHMFVVYPPDHDPSRRYPLVQIIHGGPFGAHMDWWSWRWNSQVHAAPGYVLALVNFHGSSGYGLAFSDQILGDWGGKAAEDLLRATDLLIERGVADPQKLALAGGSFGGYMTCWLASQSDRWRCAIAHSAVYNMTSLVGADAVQGIDREIGGVPWDLPRAREAIDRFNPAAFNGAYRTPTLITHGDRDYRVPVSHAHELYSTLKAKGIPARLVCFPEENHWILKPQTSLEFYGEFLGWLARYL
jgi:dipeptidyl aminopeptidase/acylaminoacyl peptidase